MKNIFIIGLVLLIAFIGCNSEKTETENETTVPDGTRKIEVVEHLNGGGYTFLKANENGNEIWVAVREMPVEVGDVFYFTEGMVMTNFESKSLNKTFDSILFVDNVSKTPPSAKMGNSSGMPGMMPGSDGHTKPEVKAAGEINVEPLADGITIETVNKDKASLDGKTVKIRGVVTKYNGGIMGRNWIHIQDGTSFGEAIDVTVTSDNSTKVGETVVIEGKVVVDKDFGAGYFYDVLVIDATVTPDQAI